MARSSHHLSVFRFVPAPAAIPEVLEDAWSLFESNEPNAAMHGVRVLRDGMHLAKQDFESEEEWKQAIHEQIRCHPVMKAVHEDPFIARANFKPRGYAGDAVMLDFIYHHAVNNRYLAGATPRGRASTGFSTNTPAPRAVRNRAWLLAHEIDAICGRNPRAEILSLACGHLREAMHSRALQSRGFRRFVALDQDVQSLEVVRSDAGTLGIEAREGSVKSVIARGDRLGKFDFVYAAGLFDYLQDKVARRLLVALASLLKPGGKLWVANFLPDIVDRAFMESFMDWWLIYRTPAQMLELADPPELTACTSRRTFVEHESNIVFLEICR